MMQMVHSRFNALLSACVLSLIATASWSQSITWLGTLPGFDQSYAHGVSDNGVVVGYAFNAAEQASAFRWTASGGMQNLGGVGTRAYGVSADGSVVVGVSVVRAFRWTASNGMQDLGTLPGGSRSEAYGVSANGAVVVGRSYTAAARQYRAFRWTASNGMQDLGTLPGGYYSEAYGVSADGRVVVGRADNAAGRWRVFRWTASGGMQDLGGGGVFNSAFAVSADGSVVVGWADGRAFRWTASGGMHNLGTLGGIHSCAYGVSADGRVVVGWAENAARQWRAFRWTASSGLMEDLNTTYASLLTNGSELMEARAISPNGRYIVGWGYKAGANRPEAFLLDTGTGRSPCTLDGHVNGDGIVDDADLLIVLFNFGNRCP